MQLHVIKDRVLFMRDLLRSKTQRKHLFSWLRSLREDYLLNKPSPWLAFDAIAEIEKHIRPDWHVFEYGSGGSTLFWLSYRLPTVSIEHDPEWYRLLNHRLSNNPLLDYRLILPEHFDPSGTVAAPDFANPKNYLSSDVSYQNHTFQNYVAQIDEFPDQYFDLVLIDGRARPACIMHASRKVKHSGLLVLDNADRNYYTEQTSQCLQNFLVLEFVGAAPVNSTFMQTNIYQRLR